jgi:hypothetical protein
MSEDKIIVKQITEQYDAVDIAEKKTAVDLQETVEVIEVADIETMMVETGEAFSALGDPNDMSVHKNLHGITDPDQHPIVAISGLKEALDSLNTKITPQTIYSDKFGVANYYAWNYGAYHDFGYFVSLVQHTSTVQICDGSDIFGVTIDSAGFIGGQDEDIPRDYSYALVATSGLVDVRCETDVTEGDYVVSNAYGIATKTDSNCGYKVVAIERKNGVDYAAISLGVQACTTDAIGQKVQHLDDRMNDAEINIAAAINVANDAYLKANGCVASNGIISDKVDDVMTKVDDMSTEVDNLGSQVSSISLTVAQAKAIAENTALFAESMKNEAVDKANEALTDTAELRKELEAQAEEIDSNLNNVSLDLQATKENIESLATEMEPLVTWPDEQNPTGVAGFVAKANENATTLASIVAWQGETDTVIAGFKQEVSETYATIESVTSLEIDMTNSIAGLKQDVAKEYATIASVTQLEIGTSNAITEVKQEASKTYATIDSVAQLKINTTNALSNYKQEVSNTYATNTELATLSIDTTNAIAASEKKATATYASKSDLTSFESNTNVAMARIEQKADANGAYIHSTVSNMDKYSVGPYSQAQGFTLNQAKTVLEVGMIYVPTVSHSGETYNTSYNFTTTNTYTWSGTTWTESVGKVIFSASVPSGNAYPLWYTNNSTVSDGYEPYTLYKLETYKNEAGETLSQWVAVATLAGNSSSRAVSQIRQDANSIDISVTNMKGDVTSSKNWISNNAANIQDVVSWKSNNATTIATTIQKASDSEAYIAQIASVKNDDGSVNAAASIVTAVNADKSAVTISADKINFSGFTTFLSASDLGESGKTTIHGSRIETGTISADKIDASVITAEQLSTKNSGVVIEGSNIRADTINTSQLVAGSVTGSVIASNTIDATHIIANSITATEIDADSITAAVLTANNLKSKIATVDILQVDAINIAENPTIGNGSFTCNGLTARKSIYARQGMHGDVPGKEFYLGQSDKENEIWGGGALLGTWTYQSYEIATQNWVKNNYHDYKYVDDNFVSQSSLSSSVSSMLDNGVDTLTADKCYLGANNATSYRYGTWIMKGTEEASTSDKNYKNTIHSLSDKYSTLFDSLKPSTFKFNDGTSNRFHVGFIAQEVEEAIVNADLTTQDFAGLVIDKSINEETNQEEERYYLRYGEFIALNTNEIQKLKQRVISTEKEIVELKQLIAQTRKEE